MIVADDHMEDRASLRLDSWVPCRCGEGKNFQDGKGENKTTNREVDGEKGTLVIWKDLKAYI